MTLPHMGQGHCFPSSDRFVDQILQNLIISFGMEAPFGDTIVNNVLQIQKKTKRTKRTANPTGEV